MKLLIAIINHGLNTQALELKRSLGRHAAVVAIDSGSTLSEEERRGFDQCLPNVFFGGCVRAAVALGERVGCTHLWLWASDVSCADPALAVLRCRELLSLADVGVYAPSADYSFHRQMAPRPGRGISRVSFTDGFCFAARLDLLSRTSRDFRGARYGFGIDIHLGYLARMSHCEVLVDHECRVSHPKGAGYSVRDASNEWRAWLMRQSLGTRLFHGLARKRISKTRVGMRTLLALPWSLKATPWPRFPFPASRQPKAVPTVAPELP